MDVTPSVTTPVTFFVSHSRPTFKKMSNQKIAPSTPPKSPKPPTTTSNTIQAPNQTASNKPRAASQPRKSSKKHSTTPRPAITKTKTDKIFHTSDDSYFSPFYPCCKCSGPPRSILKGIYRSLPRQKHIVQYWRHRLSRKRIDQNKNAIVVDGNNDLNISYRELDVFSNSIAHNLKQAKFPPGQEVINASGEFVIAICHPACYEYIVIVLAILKLGAAILPISIDLPPYQIAEILKVVEPVLLIAAPHEDDLFRDILSIYSVEVIFVDEIWNMLVHGIHEEHPLVTPIDSNKLPPYWKRPVVVGVVPSKIDRLSVLSFDSRAILNRIKWEDHFFVYYSSEYVLMPAYFDSPNSIADIMTALTIGVTIIAYQSPTDILIPEQLFGYCQNYKIRRLLLWPSLLKACTSAMHLFTGHLDQIRTVRYWFCFGGVLRSELGEEFFSLLPPNAQLIHMYTFSACLGAVAFQSYETLVSHKHRAFYMNLPFGYPAPNMDIYLLDENCQPVRDGELGVIYVSGIQLATHSAGDLSYVDNPYSHNSDKKLMLRTMDMARVFTKSNGLRVLVHEGSGARNLFIENQVVWLESIEHELNKLDIVQDSFCLTYRANEDDQLILAFCEASDKSVTGEVVEESLKKVLSNSIIPEVILVESLREDGGVDETRLLNIYQKQRGDKLYFEQWDKVRGPSQFVLRAAKMLAYVLFIYLGVPIRFIVEKCWNSPYLSIHRATITKGAFIVKELHRNRYPIYVDDFIFAEDLQRIAEMMVIARKERGVYKVNNCPADEAQFLVHRYKLEIMVNSNRHNVCSLLARALTYRGQLDYYAEVSHSQLRTFFDVLWPLFVSKNLSLTINRKRVSPRMVGVALAINWHDEFKFTKFKIPPEIMYKLELMAHLEAGLTDYEFSQTRTNVIQVCCVGLDQKVLTDAEIHGLWDKIVRTYLALGKVKGFEAIVVITYDYFCYDICVRHYDFKVARQCQVNQWTASDGTQPFSHCPDAHFATLCWKMYGRQ